MPKNKRKKFLKEETMSLANKTKFLTNISKYFNPNINNYCKSAIIIQGIPKILVNIKLGAK